MSKDYYKILNVERNSNEDEIKTAYRKLALKHHPDKNQGNPEAVEKFKEISEAYSVIGDKDKRKQYDVMGSVDDNFGDEDPFNVFNNIFQQHMNSFMNMKYENDINVNDIFSNLTGMKGKSMPFGNIHVRVHTFPNDILDSNQRINNNSSFNEFHNFSNFFEQDEEDDDVEDINIGGIFSKFFNKNVKTKETFKQEVPIKTKILYDKPDDIIYDIKVSLEDIYENNKKKITITRKRKVDGQYIDKKKKIEIPIYAKELTLYGQGNELKDYKERGDVIINIFNKKDDKFKRVNEYDVLTHVDIELNKIYGSFCYELILPHNEVLLVQSEKLNLNENFIQRINKKGLPYEVDDKSKYGNLYVLYNIIYPSNFDDLKKIEKYEDKTNISQYFHIAYNCKIHEIFNEEC